MANERHIPQGSPELRSTLAALSIKAAFGFTFLKKAKNDKAICQDILTTTITRYDELQLQNGTYGTLNIGKESSDITPAPILIRITKELKQHLKNTPLEGNGLASQQALGSNIGLYLSTLEHRSFSKTPDLHYYTSLIRQQQQSPYYQLEQENHPYEHATQKAQLQRRLHAILNAPDPEGNSGIPAREHAEGREIIWQARIMPRPDERHR